MALYSNASAAQKLIAENLADLLRALGAERADTAQLDEMTEESMSRTIAQASQAEDVSPSTVIFVDESCARAVAEHEGFSRNTIIVLRGSQSALPIQGDRFRGLRKPVMPSKLSLVLIRGSSSS